MPRMDLGRDMEDKSTLELQLVSSPALRNFIYAVRKPSLTAYKRRRLCLQQIFQCWRINFQKRVSHSKV